MAGQTGGKDMEMVRELSPEKAPAALHCPEYPSPSPGI